MSFTSLSVVILLAFTALFCDAAESEHNTVREKRSDDANPLGAVVDEHSQELVQIKAQLAALTAKMEDQLNVVSFTVYPSEAHVTGLGIGQPVVFDAVAYNAGNGYDKNTGIFTAPVDGTYVFSLNLQRHGSDEDTLIMLIKKNGAVIGKAEAGYSPYEHGSMLVTTHLVKGDTIFVEPSHGTTIYGGISTVFSGFRVSP